MVAGTHFTAILQEVLDGSLLINAMFISLLLIIIEQSGLLLAISYFLSLLSTLSQLHTRNEMHIIFSLGVSESRLFFWLVLPTVLLSFVVGALVFYITPLSAFQLNHLYGTQVVHRMQRIDVNESEFSNNVAVRVNDRVFQLLRVEDDLVETIEGRIAKVPELSDSQVILSLERGFLLKWTMDESIRTRFMEGKFHIPYRLRLVASVSAASTLSLWSGGRREHGELYQRIAIFLSIPFSLPLALVATRRRVRAGMILRTFFGIFVYFLYLIGVIASIGLVRSSDNIIPFWLIQASFFGVFIVSLFSSAVFPLRLRRLRQED